MTESDWLSATDPDRMLVYLQLHRRITRSPGGFRRLRLLAVATCRRVWPLLEDPRIRAAVEAAERYADGRGRKRELERARESAVEVERAAAQKAWEAGIHAPEALRTELHRQYSLAAMAVLAARTFDLAGSVRLTLMSRARFESLPSWGDPRAAARSRRSVECVLAELVRDIFGNPFHPALVADPSWLAWQDDTIPRLAREIYNDRAFDRLPNLADALEDAGCSDARFLGHCRQRGEHARGCWLLDALLGRV
jgi:hypothetical protein